MSDSFLARWVSSTSSAWSRLRRVSSVSLRENNNQEEDPAGFMETSEQLKEDQADMAMEIESMGSVHGKESEQPQESDKEKKDCTMDMDIVNNQEEESGHPLVDYPKTCHHLLTKRMKRDTRNMYYTLEQMQIQRRPIHLSAQSLIPLPQAMISRMDRDHNGIIQKVFDLRSVVRSGLSNATIETCMNIYDELDRSLTDARTSMHNTDHTTKARECRQSFVQFGGIEITGRLFMMFEEMYRTNKAANDASSNMAEISDGRNRRILNLMMNSLRELFYWNSKLTRRCCYNDQLIAFLFELMRDPQVFDNAVGLCEEILAAREDLFDLSGLDSFHQLLQDLSSRQLAFFCRVLALVIFEPEDRHLLEKSKALQSTELLQLRRNRLLREDSIIHRNHAIVIAMPQLLPRLLVLLSLQNSRAFGDWPNSSALSDFAASTEIIVMLSEFGESEDWGELVRFADIPNSELLENAATCSPSEITSRNPLIMARPPRNHHETALQFKAIALAPHQVEVLFVLCTLLSGRRNMDVQDRLADLGLIGILDTVFDRIDWSARRPHHELPERLHGPDCECNPESALRVQLLRLIHNFCDRDGSNRRNKMMLLTEEEQKHFYDLSMEPFTYDPPRKGLLLKLIDIYMKEPADSAYKFWLASCVEAFLRGASPADQLFIARTRLFPLLIREVTSDGFRCAGSLQTSFDLLGEITKGNPMVLHMLNNIISEEEFARLMEVVVSHLVDSNVFVRSMLLSLHKICCVQAVLPMPICHPYDDLSCVAIFENSKRSYDFISKNLIRLIRDLMSIVRLDSVNHENICCLNTAVILFVFANRAGEIPFVLEELKKIEPEEKLTGTIQENFRALLWFWDEYYSHRGRDRLSLEKSSNVKFGELHSVVKLLSADNGSSTSLLSSPLCAPISRYAQRPSLLHRAD